MKHISKYSYNAHIQPSDFKVSLKTSSQHQSLSWLIFLFYWRNKQPSVRNGGDAAFLLTDLKVRARFARLACRWTWARNCTQLSIDGTARSLISMQAIPTRGDCTEHTWIHQSCPSFLFIMLLTKSRFVDTQSTITAGVHVDVQLRWNHAIRYRRRLNTWTSCA